jgi:hypothetical protein
MGWENAETSAVEVVTPDEFRRFATQSGWQLRSIDLFLKPPYCRTPVYIDKEGSDSKFLVKPAAE